MGNKLAMLGIAAVLTALPCNSLVFSADSNNGAARNIQVGPRPYFLVEDLDPGPLKTILQQCSDKPLKKTDFSIGHRGAALQFPSTQWSHTKRPRAWARGSSSVM